MLTRLQQYGYKQYNKMNECKIDIDWIYEDHVLGSVLFFLLNDEGHDDDDDDDNYDNNDHVCSDVHFTSSHLISSHLISSHLCYPCLLCVV
jgi:hypothetical protein